MQALDDIKQCNRMTDNEVDTKAHFNQGGGSKGHELSASTGKLVYCYTSMGDLQLWKDEGV